MGFLSKLFGKKVQEKADYAFYEKVINQVTISDSLKEELKTSIKEAFENPMSFYDDNNEYMLSDRGLMYPNNSSDTPLYVFIDTLKNNGHMTEIDWKEEEYDIRTEMNEILMAKEYSLALTYDDLYENKRTDKILELINKQELEPAGYSTAMIDIGSDSYVFTIVTLDKKQEIDAWFAKL